MNINKKLIVFIFFFIILPMTSIGIAGYYASKSNIQQIRLDQLEAIADLKKDRINSFFDSLKEDIRIVQDYYNIRHNLPVMSEYIHKRTAPAYIQAKEMLKKQLLAWGESKAVIKDLMLVDPGGKIVYSNNPDHEEVDLGFSLPDPGNRAFAQGLKGIYLSEIFRNEREANQYSMLISAPVRDYGGELAGVVVLEVDMEGIYSFIQDRTGLGETGETLIGKNLGDRALFLNPLRHDAGAAMKRTAIFGKADAFPIQEAVQGRDGAGLSVDYRGVEIIAVWRYIPALKWGLVAKVDSMEAYAPVRRIRDITLAFTALVIFLSALITLAISRSISRPIKELMGTAEKIGLGDFSIRAGVGGGGEITTLAGSINSMAEKLESRERELNRQRAFAQAVLENIEDGIVACDEAGTLSYFNRVTKNFHGIGPRELTPEEWPAYYDLYLEDGRSLMKKEDIPLFRAYRGEEVRDVEMVIAPKEGGRRIVRASGSAMYDDQGNKIGAVVSMHDVTQQKRTDEELRRHRDELEKLVTERTRKLEEEIAEHRRTERELKKAKKEADAANRAKSEFVANMSHEIRTPMNAIIGMADLLKESDLTSEQKNYAEVLSRAGEGLLFLINDTLDLSKIESGGLKIDKSVFDLPGAIRHVVDILSINAEKKGLKLASDIKKDVPSKLKGDSAHLQQILFNLTGNAIKFTDEGEVVIEVESLPGQNGGKKNRQTLRFAVRDTGRGIPKEMQDKIFERFTQVRSSISRAHGGTGLGTTISRGLVTLMGGEIWVESEEGKGSTFFFTIPFDMPEKGEDVEEGRSMPMPVTTPSDLPLSLLLAEDSLDNQLLIEAFFKKTPIKLHIADNGKEVCEMYKKGNYDLILMDMEMPVMDGYEATREIRLWEAENDRKAVPIIALTAHALKEYEEKSLDAGCTAHVTKPIKKNHLLRVIYQYSADPGKA